MTPTEMETLLQKLDARVANIEQILPTLATREGLAAVEHGLRTDLTEQIHASAQAVRTELTEKIHASAQSLRTELTDEIRSSANGLRVLIEASRDDTRVLAEHVLDLMTRLPRGQ